ncbi:TetR/AcrR family transcriptional regulator [Corynebacterium amycolatum]|uniref:TetR/AcrR family transcriptional regulator n=1 Tax=Corynebacterium amycolatum TaxID=43765 RepID=UPI0012B6B5DA|nr:TetR/AcrR family transcriptional regulator [Corynebacterium amycolatum]KAA9287796.1 TetR/AcrR family transcriptional regulator [Corynebacterium amycolatum]
MTCTIESTDGVPAQPDVRRQSPRMQKIVDEARAMLRESGWSAISMRRLAARLDVKAPSLYKHISGKEELLQLLLTESLENLGKRIHAAIDEECTSASLLQAYRQAVLDDPHGYRLMSRTNFVNVVSPSSLDAWIRDAFIKVAGDESKGLAMWAFAHGLVTAELVQDGSPALEPSAEAGAADSLAAVGAIWDAGAEAFS